MLAIAESTKISVRYLEAIEEGNFKVLPGGVYSVSYLRQYAEAVDYDPDQLIDQYNNAMGLTPATEIPPELRPEWTSRFWSQMRLLRTLAWHRGTRAARG